MTCDTCGATTGWVDGVKLERANESKREAMKNSRQLRAENAQLRAKLEALQAPEELPPVSKDDAMWLTYNPNTDDIVQWCNDYARQAQAIVKSKMAVPPPPHECKTEAEKTAYAFGWWKALEAARINAQAAAPVQEVGINGLTKAETDASMSVRGLSKPVPQGERKELLARAEYLHENSSGTWDEAVSDALREVGVDDDEIDRLISECCPGGKYENMYTKDDFQRFTRSIFLHSSNAKPQRKPLTYEQIADMLLDAARDSDEMHDFARDIEAAHGITPKEPT